MYTYMRSEVGRMKSSVWYRETAEIERAGIHKTEII